MLIDIVRDRHHSGPLQDAWTETGDKAFYFQVTRGNSVLLLLFCLEEHLPAFLGELAWKRGTCGLRGNAHAATLRLSHCGKGS